MRENQPCIRLYITFFIYILYAFNRRGKFVFHIIFLAEAKTNKISPFSDLVKTQRLRKAINLVVLYRIRGAIHNQNKLVQTPREEQKTRVICVFYNENTQPNT